MVIEIILKKSWKWGGDERLVLPVTLNLNK
jgi:hypothetical protein